MRLYTEGIGSTFRVKKIAFCKDCPYYAASRVGGVICEGCCEISLPEADEGTRRQLRVRDAAGIAKPAPVAPPFWCPLPVVSEMIPDPGPVRMGVRA